MRDVGVRMSLLESPGRLGRWSSRVSLLVMLLDRLLGRWEGGGEKKRVVVWLKGVVICLERPCFCFSRSNARRVSNDNNRIERNKLEEELSGRGQYMPVNRSLYSTC